MSGVVEALMRAADASVISGRLVRKLTRTQHGFTVVHGATNDEQSLAADAVVLAVPSQPAARLLTEVAPAATADLAGIDYASVVIVTVAFARGDWPVTTGSGYLVPALPDRPVKAVTYSSAKWPHLATEDVVVVRASIGRYGDVADVQHDDEELIALVRAELTRTLGVRAAPVDSRVTRWGGALPQYTVGHLDRVGRIRSAVATVPGLAVCGAAYDGVGVPACIASARAAAQRLEAALSAAAHGYQA
jgi:oxygen-dependent protoporphyrinogen oxidase